MQQILSAWSGIDDRKRLVVLLAALAMFAAVIGLSRLATQPTMSLLYSGLDPMAAGDVVAELEQRAVPYEIRGNAIFVDSPQRDQLRMVLAGKGLPANNGKGYELLDTLSGFGTTAQMFDAAYWRAKEGELARTIVASPLFDTARVHISNVSTSAFRRTLTPTASVTVTTGTGSLDGANAKALKYLVSSAVSGMSPADVAIIDGRNGVVISDSTPSGGSDGTDDRAKELKKNVERLLEARVGPGNVAVEVNVATTTDSETIFERRLDPDSRVAISTLKEERSTNSSDSGNSAVTVASNLPQGDAGNTGGNSTSENAETRETVNYEVAETTRELSRRPGSIQRISVAVLVNEVREWDPETNTATWVPRSEEEIAALRDLVATAVGYDPERGDSVTLKSMRFEELPAAGTAAELSAWQNLNLDIMRLIQLAVLAVVSVALGLFVLRPILLARPAPDLPVPAIPGRTQDSPARNAANPAAPLVGEIDDGTGFAQDVAVVGDRAPDTGNVAFGQQAPMPDPISQLRELIADKQDETVDVLKDWIDSSEERA